VPGSGGSLAPMPRSQKTERRFVRIDDPTLSDETNEQLSGELRGVVGRDEVRAPAARRDSTRGRHGGSPPLLANIVGTRIGYQLTLAAAVVVAFAVLAFVTGSIVLVVVALVVLLAMVVVVIRSVVSFAGQMEHPSPELAARMEQEGVRDPDRLMEDMVQDFTAPGAKAEGQKPPPDGPSGQTRR
jgi:hypothetical protein